MGCLTWVFKKASQIDFQQKLLQVVLATAFAMRVELPSSWLIISHTIFPKENRVFYFFWQRTLAINNSSKGRAVSAIVFCNFTAFVFVMKLYKKIYVTCISLLVFMTLQSARPKLS